MDKERTDNSRAKTNMTPVGVRTSSCKGCASRRPLARYARLQEPGRAATGALIVSAAHGCGACRHSGREGSSRAIQVRHGTGKYLTLGRGRFRSGRF